MVKPSAFLTRGAKPDARSKLTHAGCRLGHLGWLIRSLGGCRSPDPPLVPGWAPVNPYPQAKRPHRLPKRRQSATHCSTNNVAERVKLFYQAGCHIPFRFTISMEAPHSGYRDDYPGTQHRISANHPRMQRHGGGRGGACLDKNTLRDRATKDKKRRQRHRGREAEEQRDIEEERQ